MFNVYVDGTSPASMEFAWWMVNIFSSKYDDDDTTSDVDWMRYYYGRGM